MFKHSASHSISFKAKVLSGQDILEHSNKFQRNTCDSFKKESIIRLIFMLSIFLKKMLILYMGWRLLQMIIP